MRGTYSLTNRTRATVRGLPFKKIKEQVDTLEHSLFSGFTHEPGIQLAERLLKHLPANQNKIFYSDDGSTSVEVALKMTLQY
jgi:adenosylmethionine-8-amino-7-oxononanoate aminotransferase